MTTLTGRIVRVCSDTEVVINLGSEAKVEPGMRFAIKATSVEIRDTDGTTLGSLDRSKGTVVVRRVFARFCLAQTEMTIRTKPVLRSRPQWSEFWGAAFSPAPVLGSEAYADREKLQVRSDKVEPIDEDLAVVPGDTVEAVPSTPSPTPSR